MPATKEQIARLMTIWVCSSRHDVRAQVANGNWGADLTAMGIAVDLLATTRAQLKDLYTIGLGTLTGAAATTTDVVDDDWKGDPCPPNNFVEQAYKRMLHAANLGPMPVAESPPPDPPTANQLARLMTIWVCSSRDTLRSDVANGLWVPPPPAPDLELIGISGQLTSATRTELQGLYNGGSLLAPAAATNEIVDLNWSGDPCPPNNYVTAALNGLLDSAGLPLV